MGGAEGIEPRYGDFEIGCSCLFERSCRTPLHQNSQVSRNTRISRTVPNPQSPELWREMSHSEKKGRILPIRGLELKSEIAANTGVHYQHPRAEKRWLRRSWRSERDSNARYRTLDSTSPRKLDARFRVATKEPYSLVLARRNGFELGTMSALAGRR